MIYTILVFVVILFILVIAHEMGHFLTAKRFKVAVQEFGLGLPPRAKLITTFKSGLKLTLNWLPLGGFVKLKGEDGDLREDTDSFANRKIWQKIVILSSGVVMNIILAFLLLSIGFSIGWPSDLTTGNISPKYIKSSDILIIYVEKNSPADLAGIQVGDFIKKINNANYKEIKDIQEKIKLEHGKKVDILILREKELKEFKITPQEIEFHIKDGVQEKELLNNSSKNSNNQNINKDNRQPINIEKQAEQINEVDARGAGDIIKKTGIGVALAKIGVVRYPAYLAFYQGAKNTIIYSGKIIMAFYNLLKDLIFKHKVSPEIGGPVAIAVFSGKAARLGFIYILQFIAILSLNLAVINILPFPALDGGRVLFAVIEKLKGRAVSSQVEIITHTLGFWLLIIFALFITLRDIDKFGLWDKIKGVFK